MSKSPPVYILLLIILCVWVFRAKREDTIVPLIVTMCFLPADIPIMLGPLHFYALRVIGLTGLIKMFANSSYYRPRKNTIDILFLSYNFLGALIYIIASQDKWAAFVYQSGMLVDSVVLYYVIRHAITSSDNLKQIIRTFSICALILAPFIVVEFFTATNLFSILGRSAISIRNGEIRAAGTFNHSILFGSFGAALIPLLWAGYKTRINKKPLLALGSCLFFVVASSSSGPIVVLAGVIFFLYFFRWRHYGSLLAWFMLISAIIIHNIRESPIWHLLFVRLTIKASSTGYHRYLLVDAAVKEFKEWWLLGYGAAGPQWHTKYWPRNHAHFTDVTNHYLLIGVRGGFITMLLFILLCYYSIKYMGMLSTRQQSIEDQWIWWGFTVMMIAHCITFLSVAYFGQITMILYLTIAVAAYAKDELDNTSLPTPIN